MKPDTSSATLLKRLEREASKVRILERMLDDKTRELWTEQQRLRSLNSHLNNVLETMLSALIVTDDQFRVERANQMAQRLLGWDMFELLGMPLSQFIPLERIAPAEALAAAGVLQIETVVTNREGLKIPVLASSSLIWNEPGETSSLVCVLVDLRQRKQLETQLLQTQKLESVGQLAAGIAHEINTPIQFIGDNLKFLQGAFGDLIPLFQKLCGLMREHENGDKLVEAVMGGADYQYLQEEVPSAIDQSLQGVDRVAKIVRAMKEFSHPGREAKQAVDLKKLIESTITISTNEWKYIAEVNTKFAPELPMVPAIPGALSQAFLNLIINAVHAIDDTNKRARREKGLIDVSVFPEGPKAVIAITDNGGGIPEEIRHRVFEPFFTTKDVGRGSGQGLAISRSIVVDKHGGELDFTSEPGKGTTFIVRLPLG